MPRKKNPDNLKLRDMDRPTVLGYELDPVTLTPLRGTLPAAKAGRVAVGDRVTYSDVNLRLAYRGTVVAVGRTEGGGDCTVKWDARSGFEPITAGECSSNLIKE